MSSEVQQLIRQWKVHRNVTIELVKLLPESMKDYKAWDGGMTTIGLIHHLAWTPKMLLSRIGEVVKEVPEMPETIAEALVLLEENTAKHEEIMSNWTKEDLSKNAFFEGINVTETGEEVFHLVIGHEAHHKAQLMTYARLNGVEPPFFVDFTIGK